MANNRTLQPGIKTRTQVMNDRTVHRIKRGVPAQAIPTPPAPHCLAYIWPYDGAFLMTLHTDTRKVFRAGQGTVACYYTFPTEDAAIMCALMAGENK